MNKNYKLKKGQVLFKEGSLSDAAFIIESGKVEIKYRTLDELNKIINSLK